MHRRLLITFLGLLLSSAAMADWKITKDKILQVMDASDAAALERDAAAISIYLSDRFERRIEFPHKGLMAKVRLKKMEYLQMIDEGWAGIDEYNYQRDNVEIHIMPDGITGRSHSTVTENITVDGIRMTSRFREYATYAMENGRAVIIEVGGHTLLGDTTPQ
jgi:hypothetical protein